MDLRKKLDIPDDNPFLNDKFNRKVFVDNLMPVMDAYDSGMVVSIDSSWGTGKTTFIKMWEAYLKNDKFKDKYEAIYFNAWENDDSIDPLVPLINTISEKNNEENGVSEIETKLKKTGSMLIKKAIPFALRLASHGIINVSETDMDSFSKKQIEDYAGKIGEAAFAEQKQSDDLKNEFKNILQEYQRFIGKKVIIFIDELDRCRPLYAIETLEKIKHFFEIDNFIFVLSMDKTQLAYSISTIYGNNMDSVGYLRRFIDLELTLPEPNVNAYFDYKISEYELNFKNTEYFWAILKDLSKIKNISLRDIDKLFINIRILLPQIDIFKENANFKDIYTIASSSIYAYLLLLKITNQNDYKKILNKNYKHNEISVMLDAWGITSFEVSFNGYNEAILKAGFHDGIRKFLELNQFNLENEETYRKAVQVNQGRYVIGYGDELHSQNMVDLIKLWGEERQSTIINNLMFTNSLKDEN